MLLAIGQWVTKINRLLHFWSISMDTKSVGRETSTANSRFWSMIAIMIFERLKKSLKKITVDSQLFSPTHNINKYFWYGYCVLNNVCWAAQFAVEKSTCQRKRFNASVFLDYTYLWCFWIKCLDAYHPTYSICWYKYISRKGLSYRSGWLIGLALIALCWCLVKL